MTNKIKNFLIFFSIILISIFLRFYHLSTIPNSLTIDEIGNGYNAYSLLKTGKDEWGIKFPPYFRSTGDYDAPVMIYLMVPPVWAFGLNEFSVRFIQALFSLLITPLIFLIFRKYIFPHKSIYYSFAAMLFYATSQWNIFFSRSGFEAVIALGFVMLNIYFLFRSIEKKNPLIFYLALAFAYISAISYSSNKIFVPLINLLFVVLNWRAVFEIFKIELDFKKWRLILFSVVTLILLFVLARFWLFGPGAVRAKMVFFTGDYELKVALLSKLGQVGLSILDLPMLVLFWIKRFLEYFSTNFYIIDGLGLTIPGHPGAGVLNLAVFPLYIVGLISLFIPGKEKHLNKIKTFLLGWFIIGLIPATLANNSQHALRTLNSSVAVILISTVGLAIVIDYLIGKSKNLVLIFLGVFILLFSLDFVRFIDYYTVHYPFELSETRQYGWKEMAIYARDHHSEYDNVYVDPRFGSEGRTNYGVPYSYFQFYSRYDPNTFHSFPGREKFISDFENYHFLEIDFNQMGEVKGNNLYIASPWSFPDYLINEKHIRYEVKFLNGKVGFYAISNQPNQNTR